MLPSHYSILPHEIKAASNVRATNGAKVESQNWQVEFADRNYRGSDLGDLEQDHQPSGRHQLEKLEKFLRKERMLCSQSIKGYRLSRNQWHCYKSSYDQ